MRAVDAQGYEQRFDEGRGKWVPLIARGEGDSLHLFKPKTNEWERQKTGDEQLSTLQKIATSIPLPGDGDQSNIDTGVELDSGNIPAKSIEPIGADVGDGSVREPDAIDPLQSGTSTVSRETNQPVSLDPLKQALPDAEGNFSQPKFPGQIQPQENEDTVIDALKQAAGDFKFGYDQSASSFFNTAANASMLVDRASDYMAEKTGLEKGGAFKTVEDYLRGVAAQVAPDPADAPQDTAGKINAGLGSVPIAIGEYIPAIKALGPILGFGAVDALTAADQGLEAAATAGVKGAAFGGALKVTEPLTRVGKIAALAVIGGSTAAAEGGDASDVTSSAAVLGILGAMAPGGNVRLRDIPGNVRESFPGDPIKAQAKDIEKSQTTGVDAEARRLLNPENAQLQQVKAEPAAKDVQTVTETVKVLESGEKLTDAQKDGYKDAISRMDADQVRAIINPKAQKLPVSEKKPAAEQPKAIEAAQAKAEPVKAEEKPAEKPKATITDPAEVQKIRNSIAEGEGILKSGRDSIGKKMSPEKLEGVRRSVESSKAKIGEGAEAVHIEKGKKAEPATEKVIKDAAREIDERRFGEIDLARAKSALQKDIDAAMKEAPTRQEASEKFNARIGSNNRFTKPERVGYVTFDVKGDGKFKILNTKENLAAFRKKIGGAFVKPSKPRKGSGSAPRTEPSAVSRFLEDGEFENAHELALVSDRPLKYGAPNLPYAQARPPKNAADFEGIDVFIGKGKDGLWYAIENNTGGAISGKGAKSAKAAEEQAIETIKSFGGLEKAIEKIKGFDQIGQDAIEAKFKKTHGFKEESAEPKKSKAKAAPKQPKKKAQRRPANADFAPEKTQAKSEGKKKSTRNDPDFTVPDHHISPDGLKMHELVELSEILTGNIPKVSHNFPDNLRGKMQAKGDDARVFINGLLSKDPANALKTLAHEIGHVVDWVDPKNLKLGNILGHVAGVKKYLKRFLSESPDAKEGPLTPADIRRLKSEARKMAKLEYEKKVDKAITEDYQVTPKDILDIWNAVEKSKVPGLEEYMARATTAEKKSIVRSAMKGLVPEQVQAVARAAKDIKNGKKPDGSDLNEKDIFEMLLMDEIQRRRLFSRDVLTTELKAVSKEWRPFERGNAKYDKYRDSPAELYADAVSMFFNNPEMLRSMAPEFFRGFHSWAKNRPLAMRAISGLLKARGGSLTRLDERIGLAFNRAEVKRASEYERDVKLQSGSWLGAKSALYDKYSPILDLVEKVKLKPSKNPRFAIEALTHVNTRNEGYLADFSEAFIKLGGSEKLVNVAGKYMLYERIIGENKAGNDRFAIGGITHTEAVKLKDAIDKEFGTKVGDFTKRFREVRKDWIMDIMVESGLYSEGMKKAFIREDGHYATFKNVGFIDAMDKLYTGGTGFATIKQRLGSFGDIENPVMATLAQDITMLAAAERNHVVRKTSAMLNKHFTGDIRPAEKAWDGKALSFVELHPKADEGLVIFMENGHKKGYYISKSIADALKDPKRTNEVEYFVNFSLSQPGRAIKTLFTEANPGFWVTNVMRDYARGATGTPGANAATFLPSYIKAIPESIKSGFGKDSPRIKEMLKNYELISVADYRSLNQQDGQLYRLLARFHVSPSDLKQPKSLSGKAAKAIRKGWFYYSGLARGLERIPKVAAIRFLEKRQPDISKEERRHMILGQIGSPDFLRAGSEMKVYNNILLFGNAIKEGIRSDIEVIKDRPADYFFNAFTITYLPRILMLLTAAGLMDTETDKKAAVINKQTDYRKHNSTLIPLGYTENNEGVALSIALDPFQKFQVNLLETAIKGAYSGDYRKFLKDMSHTLRGELPGITPIIDLYKDANAFADETQILTYRGRNVFSRRALAQAPVDPSLLREEFFSYLWNNYGGSMLYRIPGSNIEKQKSDLVEALDLPIVGNILRRLISVSDYGEVQKINAATAKIDANRSLAKQSVRDAIIRIANKEATDEDRVIYLNAVKGAPKEVARIVKSIQKAKQPALVRALWKIRKDPEKLKAAAEALQ